MLPGRRGPVYQKSAGIPERVGTFWVRAEPVAGIATSRVGCPVYSALAEVLKPADDGLLVAQAVNLVVNSPRVDDPRCLEPADVPAADLFG